MLKNERFEDFTDTLKIALSGWQRKMWTALPGQIQSFNVDQQTCTVIVTLMMQRVFPDGSTEWLNIPLLRDVPVQFPSGGGFTLTFPVTAGDECLVVFSSRCIDSWWQSGGTQNPQAEYRMHDLSDGFAVLGFRSLPRMLSNVSTTSSQLRSDDGLTYVDVAENVITVKAATVNVNAATSATITSPSIILKNTGAALLNLLNSLFATWAEGHVHNIVGGGVTDPPTTAPGANTQTSVVRAE